MAELKIGFTQAQFILCRGNGSNGLVILPIPRGPRAARLHQHASRIDVGDGLPSGRSLLRLTRSVILNLGTGPMAWHLASSAMQSLRPSAAVPAKSAG